MLLLVDIGNTNITIGFYDNGIKGTSRLNTKPGGKDINGYSFFLEEAVSSHQMGKPAGAIMCSVVPGITPLFAEAVKMTFGIKPLNVSHDIKTDLRFCVNNPEELGTDRIANSVAAHKLFKGNLIVIDFGTATTFCVISSEGDYKGGAIIPGLNISVDALSNRTAKLPRVELKPPRKAIGDSTESNIVSGLILGHAGAVERIIKEFKEEILAEGNTVGDIRVIATGGHVNLMGPYIGGIDEIKPLLTLEGLRIIYELNA